jgi:hypothetical protein
MSRYRGDTCARMPAGAWPTLLAAFVAGRVAVNRWTHLANPHDLLANHEPEEALSLAWERHEAHAVAAADRPTTDVPW